MALNANILLGVSGGVAAYKAVDLASKLTAAGATVRTLMTASACQLVTPKSFEAVTGQPVYTDLWASDPGPRHRAHQPGGMGGPRGGCAGHGQCPGQGRGRHLRRPAEHGPVRVLAEAGPAGPSHEQPDVGQSRSLQRNVQTLTGLGLRMIGPESGRLACGDTGVGRMAEPAQILETLTEMAKSLKARDSDLRA